jgi:hypothetical protein
MPAGGEQPYGSVKVRGLEYRGKQNSVVQGLDAVWKWSVPASSAKPNRARRKAYSILRCVNRVTAATPESPYTT